MGVSLWFLKSVRCFWSNISSIRSNTSSFKGVNNSSSSVWFLYGFKSDLLLSLEFQKTPEWAGFISVWAYERHRVGPREMTAIVQAHLIETLVILSGPGQTVKDFAEQVAHQNPLLSVWVPGLYCGTAKGLSRTHFQAAFSTGRLLC